LSNAVCWRAARGDLSLGLANPTDAFFWFGRHHLALGKRLASGRF